MTGDATEAQILLSVKSYIDHRDLLLLSINNLFNLFKYSQCRDHRTALEVLTTVLELTPLDWQADDVNEGCGHVHLYPNSILELSYYDNTFVGCAVLSCDKARTPLPVFSLAGNLLTLPDGTRSLIYPAFVMQQTDSGSYCELLSPGNISRRSYDSAPRQQ